MPNINIYTKNLTYKLLPVVVGEELLQLKAPVVSLSEDAVVLQRLAHVAPPRVQMTGTVRRSRIHQNVQTVHTETPTGAETGQVKGTVQYLGFSSFRAYMLWFRKPHRRACTVDKSWGCINEG